MTQAKWKRGNLVRTTARLMFGKAVIPEGTTIRVERYIEDFEDGFDVVEGNAILPTGLHLCYPLWVDDLEDVT